MIVTTENKSVYEIDSSRARIRQLSRAVEGGSKRLRAARGGWVNVLAFYPIELGRPLVAMWPRLPDDLLLAPALTTSPVVDICYDD